MRFPFDKYKYYRDANVEHKETVDELNDLLMTV